MSLDRIVQYINLPLNEMSFKFSKFQPLPKVKPKKFPLRKPGENPAPRRPTNIQWNVHHTPLNMNGMTLRWDCTASGGHPL